MLTKRTINEPRIPLTPAMTFALMIGEWSTARLPGWVALGMHGEQTEADAWAQHRDALIAEAAGHHFEPYWLHERPPSGPGFEAWRAAFLATHAS
jgi:hypothetical protein